MSLLTRRVLAGALVLGALGVPLPGCAQQTGERAAEDAKPLVSETIRTVLERDGPQAARARFDEMLRDRERYRMDQEGLSALATGYLQRGDLLKGQAVMDMLLVLIEEQARAGMAGVPPPPPAMPVDQPAESVTPDLGPTRTDLERFLGIYGDPSQKGPEARHILVRLGCNPGRLEMGALWGPVAPWVMKSVSDLEFEEGLLPAGYDGVRLVFETGPDGRAVAARTTLLSATRQLTRVPRLRDLTSEEAGLDNPLRCVR